MASPSCLIFGSIFLRSIGQNRMMTLHDRHRCFSAVCGRGPPAGAFCIPTPSPAPPRGEDLVNVHVGDGGTRGPSVPPEPVVGFTRPEPAQRCTVGLGCVGTGAVDLTIQSDRTSAAVKSVRIGNRWLGQHRQTAPPQGVCVCLFAVCLRGIGAGKRLVGRCPHV